MQIGCAEGSYLDVMRVVGNWLGGVDYFIWYVRSGFY